MKNGAWKKRLACVVFACGLAGSAEARKDELTLVLVPREATPVKLGLDLANRYPVLLATYRVLPNGAVSLHGWTGAKWVNITLANYATGNFFEVAPNATLIVEKAGSPMPGKLVPPEDWCRNVYKITTTQLRPLIHLSGRYFDFGYKDWKGFSKRYGMAIDAINPEGLNLAWYHRRLDENLKTGDLPGADDLVFWEVLRQAVAEEPPPINEEVNPLTNAVPEAVVIGAADAPAELKGMPVGAAKEPLPENSEDEME